MAKIGDKYVIEIGECYYPIMVDSYDAAHEIEPRRLFVVKGFYSMVLDDYALDILEKLDGDYVNENFGELQDESYSIGLHDAWEAAKKLFSDFPESVIDSLFGKEWNNGGFRALMNMDPEYAVQKIEEYEKKVKQGEEYGKKYGEEPKEYKK